jgi:hypothetical protein
VLSTSSTRGDMEMRRVLIKRGMLPSRTAFSGSEAAAATHPSVSPHSEGCKATAAPCIQLCAMEHGAQPGQTGGFNQSRTRARQGVASKARSLVATPGRRFKPKTLKP